MLITPNYSTDRRVIKQTVLHEIDTTGKQQTASGKHVIAFEYQYKYYDNGVH